MSATQKLFFQFFMVEGIEIHFWLDEIYITPQLHELEYISVMFQSICRLCNKLNFSPPMSHFEPYFILGYLKNNLVTLLTNHSVHVAGNMKINYHYLPITVYIMNTWSFTYVFIIMDYMMVHQAGGIT